MTTISRYSLGTIKLRGARFILLSKPMISVFNPGRSGRIQRRESAIGPAGWNAGTLEVFGALRTWRVAR